MRNLLRTTLVAALVLTAQPARAKETLQQRVEARLGQAATGTRFGLVVVADDGRELVAISPDDRFIPASNTKMFTTAAAYAFLPGLNEPDDAGGATIRLEKNRKGATDVVLSGYGDARLSSMPDCAVDCLSALADAVAAKARKVNDIVGDDTLFPVQRWSPGMSWNNIPSGDGTGVSALTLDDNRIQLRVIPTTTGEPPRLELLPYYQVDNQAVTVAEGKTDLEVTRLPAERTVRLLGTIVAGTEPAVENLGIDDPAHYAAWRLKSLLEAHGVKVRGQIRTLHRPLALTDDPKKRGDGPPVKPAPPNALARVMPPPLGQDIVTINKVSQNLHAELMLRRLGLLRGTGSIEDGQAMVQSMLASAGVPRTGFDFSDGSGMSTYNRVAPRAAVRFLRWVAAQPWGSAWRASLPIAGIDGTLRNRFKGTALQGRLFAKTGTLNATRALSGYMIAKSGRLLTFSMFANDEPAETSARETMDAALEMVANEN